MTETFNGCSFSKIWASPSNWETTTAKSALEKDCYVQCEFHDPRFNKPFQFRRRLNKIKTLAARREAIRLYLSEIEILFREKGWNPITKEYMLPTATGLHDSPELSDNLTLAEAMPLSLKLARYEGDTLKDVNSILKYFIKSATILKMESMPVKNIIGVHIDLIMDNLTSSVRTLSDKRYNKYLIYLHRLFGLLKKKGLCASNPLEGFEKKKTVVETRTTLTVQERIKIDNLLKLEHPRFWLFCNIFYHSGCREVELLRVKLEDIDLDNLKLKILVKKGGEPKIEYLPIKKVAVNFWEMAIRNAKKGEYIFSVGLLPGTENIRRDQITRRWRVHVKKKLNIEADIYSLKHSNLTEISERRSAKEAARAAGHTSDRMIKQHYDVNYKEREMDGVRNMTNQFAGGKLHPCNISE